MYDENDVPLGWDSWEQFNDEYGNEVDEYGN